MNKKNEKNTLLDFFHHVTLASGTPANYQIKIANKFPQHANNCSFYEAIIGDENGGWILKPTVNLIYADVKTNAPAALKRVFENELMFNEKKGVPTRIIFNATSIDQIKRLEENEYFFNNKGLNFHLVAVHTDKLIVNDEDHKEIKKSTIDGVEYDHRDVIEMLQTKLDKNEMFNDDLPIIILQVDTISEGINLKSCSAAVITSNTAETVVQQFGRIIRLFEYIVKGKKVKKENPNVYIFQETEESFSNLFTNLLQFDLTDNCFSWGYIIDEGEGSGSARTSRPVKMEKFKWQKIDLNNTPVIKHILNDVKVKCDAHRQEIVNLWDDLLNVMNDEDIDYLYENYGDFFVDENKRELGEKFYQKLKVLKVKYNI